MSRQTDELMGYTTLEQEAPTPAPLQDVERMRGALRALMELKKHPGYQLMIEAIQHEARHCLVSMDKASDPTNFTKFGANYFSLTMVCGWVDMESARLAALMKGVQ